MKIDDTINKMSKLFTYRKLPEHQVAIYHDGDETHGNSVKAPNLENRTS